MFCTVLHTLKSPQNVGMIVRSHAAHSGSEVIFTGHTLPWEFKKGSESFSRKLEKQVQIKHIPNPDEAIDYLRGKGFSLIALEISEKSQSLATFSFPKKSALILGNDAEGLPSDFIAKSDYVSMPTEN